MSGLKDNFPEVQFAGKQVDPDEISYPLQYVVYAPGTSQTAIGTTAVGTSTQSKALVLINKVPDYPRNLFFTLSGSADIGGSITVNGKDQFGATQSETIGFATVVSPGTSAVGTKIFGEVTSGTVTFATMAAGSGTPKLGVAYGGTAGSTALFGLPVKIGAVADVKRITITKNFVPTTLNGGTVDSTIVSTTTHSFSGTAVLGTADSFVVTVKSTYSNAGSPSYNTL